MTKNELLWATLAVWLLVLGITVAILSGAPDGYIVLVWASVAWWMRQWLAQPRQPSARERLERIRADVQAGSLRPVDCATPRPVGR